MTATTTVETAIASVASIQLGDHVVTVWEDGHVSIEQWNYSYSFDPTLDHARLDADQARALSDFLNHVPA